MWAARSRRRATSAATSAGSSRCAGPTVTVTGRIVSATPTEVTLEVPSSRSTPARTTTLPYAGVERAVVEVEFARPDESKES